MHIINNLNINVMKEENLKIDVMNEESKLIELFKKYPGIAARIRRSFAYHYDQIQREIESEVATINKDDAATIIDYTTEYMEESMGWPDADDQTTFNNQIAYN